MLKRVIGGPGAGKSSLLLEIVNKNAKEGMQLKDLLFVSFTTSQVNDVKNRIKSIYPDASEQDIKNSVRTINSAALSVLLNSGIIHMDWSGKGTGWKIIQEQQAKDVKYFESFCRENRLKYNSKTKINEDDDPIVSNSIPDGNKFFKIRNPVCCSKNCRNIPN